jgi:hypothetical protein
MKALKIAVTALLIPMFLAAPFSARAAEKQTDKVPAKKVAKAKPYPLKTCIVSDEKLGGDMGEAYVFTYQGREIKMCCKDCRKDFDKEPAKFIKKLEAAEKKAAEKK